MLTCTVYNGYMDHFSAPFESQFLRRTLAWLLVPVLFLPIATTVLFIFGRIFALLNDALSAAILDYTALALGIIWGLSLVLLLLCSVFLLLREEIDEK